MKIVLAVDGSAYTKRMLGYIAAHDELLKGDNEFVAVNATMVLPASVTGFLSSEMVHSYYTEEGDKVLKPVVEFARMQGWKLRETHVVGQPVEVLAAAVEAEKADLLVMGSHGHGIVKGAVLGSVSTRLIAHTRVPVLIVR